MSVEVPQTVLEHGTVPGSRAVLFVTTDGDSIVFSGADPAIADPQSGPNLYRAEPGRDPELLWASPRSASSLLPVATGGGYVAFAEANDLAFGEKAWILWLLPPQASEPIELDRNPPLNEAPYPTVAVNARHVVWSVVAGGPDVTRSELIDVALPAMTRTVLRTDDPSRYQWFHPDLDQDRMVVTEVDYVHGEVGSDFHPAELTPILIDLAVPGDGGVRLDDAGRATQPAIHGEWVAWKEAENVYTWGSLTLHDLSSGETRHVLTTPQSGLTNPSVGNRYVAFWGIDDTEFYLYDLKTDAPARVFQIAPDNEQGGAFRPVVAGDLLVWVQGTADGTVVAWGRLPTMDDP